MISLKPSVALTLQPHISSSSIQGFMIYDVDDQLVHRNEACLRFYETSSEPVLISQGQFLEVNASYCEQSGYKREGLLCEYISELESAENAGNTAAVSQMDHVTQQGAAPLEVMEASSASLQPQAQELVRAVAVFRLAADETLTRTRPA